MATKRKNNKIKLIIITAVVGAAITLIFSIFGDYIKGLIFREQQYVSIQKTYTYYDPIAKVNVTTTIQYKEPIKTYRKKPNNVQLDSISANKKIKDIDSLNIDSLNVINFQKSLKSDSIINRK